MNRVQIVYNFDGEAFEFYVKHQKDLYNMSYKEIEVFLEELHEEYLEKAYELFLEEKEGRK